MLGLSRHRRFSLTGETLVNPLSTVLAFPHVYVVTRPRFIPRAPKKRGRIDEGPYDIILQTICVASVR